MVTLGSGMVDGRVVPGELTTQARDALAVVADDLVDRFAASDEQLAFDWLGQLPRNEAARAEDGAAARIGEWTRAGDEQAFDACCRHALGAGAPRDLENEEAVREAMDLFWASAP